MSLLAWYKHEARTNVFLSLSYVLFKQTKNQISSYSTCDVGHLTTRSDIYSFGVVLLELLTGRRAMDKTRPKNEQNLVDWTRPYLSSSRRLRCIMDPRFGGQYSVKGTKEMAHLASLCTSLNPKDRPKIPAIIETLEALQPLRDMAVACGQWPPSPKSSNKYVVYAPKGNKDSKIVVIKNSRMGVNNKRK